MPVSEYRELRRCYYNDKDSLLEKMLVYIEDYYVIDRLQRLIESNHQLNKREEILKHIIESYIQGKFLLFSNAAPMQIEGIFNDYYLQRPKKNNLLLAVLNLFDVEIPDFYKVEEEISDLKLNFWMMKYGLILIS